MAVDLGEIRGTISLQDHFSRGIADASSQLTSRFNPSVVAAGQLVGVMAGALAAGAAAIVALGQRGSDVADVREQFAGLSQAAGLSAEVLLGELQRGTAGTVSGFDLMASANRALGSGLVHSAEDMGTLAAGARLLADRTGGDTKEAFDSLIASMQSGKTTQLQQLGLFVDSKAAIEQYAAATGQSTSELSKAEQAQAVSVATLAALRGQLGEGGPAARDFADMIAYGRVKVQDFVDNLGVAVAQSPVVRAGLDAIGRGIETAFGGSQQDTVQTLMGYVNSFAIGLTYVAQVGLTGATVLLTAWYAVKTAFLAVETAIVGILTGFVAVTEGATTLASKLPGVGQNFEGMREAVHATRQQLQGMTVSLAEQTAEAARGVVGNSDLQRSIDGLQGSVLNVRTAMEAARDTQVGAAAAVTNFSVATTAAAERSVEDSKKIREAFVKLQDDLSLAQTSGVERRLLELQQARDREIAGLLELKDLTAVELQAMAQMSIDRYQIEARAAQDHSAETLAITHDLEEQLALAHTTGIENRLMQIEIAQQRELEGLSNMVFLTGESYSQTVALVVQKYQEMSQAAQGHYASVTEAAAAAGFQTRAEQETTVAQARALYDSMRASGQFTYSELQRAHAAYRRAEADLNTTSWALTEQGFAALAQNTSGLLRQAFATNKAAAYAAAVIDTAAAVAKANSAAPFPFNIVLMAMAAAAGLIQINKIRSAQPGFRFGMEEGRYGDFGRGTTVTLHGKETAVTQGQGASLAEQMGAELSAALAAAGIGGEGAGGQGQVLQLNIAGEALDRVILRRTRAGLMLLPAGT